MTKPQGRKEQDEEEKKDAEEKSSWDESIQSSFLQPLTSTIFPRIM